MTTDILTTSEVARRAGVSPQAVRLWVASGKLIPWRTLAQGHLFDRADVDRMLATRKDSDACVDATPTPIQGVALHASD